MNLLPHSKYISASFFRIKLHYIGNEDGLTHGKQYTIRKSLYSPDLCEKRIEVYICNDDCGKIRRVKINDFKSLISFRNYKINRITKK